MNSYTRILRRRNSALRRLKNSKTVPCSQHSPIRHYTNPAELSPFFSISFLQDPIIILCHLRQDLRSSLFPSIFRTKIVYTFNAAQAHTGSVSLILLDQNILVMFGEEYKS
jgi:hypothetical protein